MEDFSAGMMIGLALGAAVFIALDSYIYPEEITHAESICAPHDGVMRIHTSWLPDRVQGVCKDGLKFDTRFKLEELNGH